jgi:hypothetical protein
VRKIVFAFIFVLLVLSFKLTSVYAVPGEASNFGVGKIDRTLSPVTAGEVRRDMSSSTSGRIYPTINPKNTILQERQEMHTAITTERQEFHASVSAEIQVKRDEFKQKLKMIKDVRKQDLLSRLATRSANINTRRTKEMLANLDHMSQILDRIELMISQLKLNVPASSPSGSLTTSSLTSLIALARAAIDQARTVVQTQAAKDYTINITTESALRVNAGQVITQLETDLNATRQQVLTAKQALMNVYTEFVKLRGMKMPRAASESGGLR